MGGVSIAAGYLQVCLGIAVGAEAGDLPFGRNHRGQEARRTGRGAGRGRADMDGDGPGRTRTGSEVGTQ